MIMDSIKIVEVDKISKNILESLQKMLPQLSTNYKSFDQNDLGEILNADSTRLFIACDSAAENEIVGTYTLVVFRIPTSKTIRIEDVIVDEKRRGKGIGKMIVQSLIDEAINMQFPEVRLSSQYYAKGFYERIGFIEIDGIYKEANIDHIKMKKRL